MKKLGQRNYLLISEGVKCTGSFDPQEVLPFCIEQLYVKDTDEIIAFLTWMHTNKKTFGWGNYEEVFAEFKSGKITDNYLKGGENYL